MHFAQHIFTNLTFTTIAITFILSKSDLYVSSDYAFLLFLFSKATIIIARKLDFNTYSITEHKYN